MSMFDCNHLLVRNIKHSAIYSIILKGGGAYGMHFYNTPAYLFSFSGEFRYSYHRKFQQRLLKK